MNTLQQILFALVSGYVVADMCQLNYEDKLFVAFITASVPFIPFAIGLFQRYVINILKK